MYRKYFFKKLKNKQWENLQEEQRLLQVVGVV
jgi:hypothetical protein